MWWFKKGEPERILVHKKGDIIVCPNGHEICEFSCDIYSNMPVSTDQLTGYRPLQFVYSEFYHPGNTCSICNQFFNLYFLHGMIFSIKDIGWRGSLHHKLQIWKTVFYSNEHTPTRKKR